MTTEPVRILAGPLRQFTAAVFEKLGVPAADAAIAADILVAADLRGVDSHGVAHLAPFYVQRIRDGRVNVTPDIRTVAEDAATAVMDADRALGFVAGHRAMRLAMSKARENGAGFVTVRNSTHYGAGACYAVMALEEDMIGISLTQGGVAIVAPGGRGKGIGSNVISVAVPAGEEAPFVLDMSTGVVAGGKLELAALNNRPIPAGWAVDLDNRPVTDVKKVTGGILPLGGTPAFGAYKGFGLAVLVDILSSVLSGDITVPEMDETTSFPGRATHFFGALKVASFMPVERFKQRMDEMVRAHHALPKAEGVERIYLAGEIEAETERDRRARGIPLHPDVVASLRELGLELNTPDRL